jgi:CheY-like chemotaxis protein
MKSSHIMLIENSNTTTKIFQHVARTCPHPIIHYNNAIDAVRDYIAHHQRIGLIITSYILSKPSPKTTQHILKGESLMERIRRFERETGIKPTPAILLTGTNPNEEESKYFLSIEKKPITPTKIKDKITTLIYIPQKI